MRISGRISRREATAGLAGFLAAQAALPAFAQNSTAQSSAPAPNPASMAPDPNARRLSQAQLEAAAAPSGEPRQVVYLWPHDAPGMPRVRPNEQVLERAPPQAALRDRALFHTLRPRLVVFRPENPNGAALLLCPGGGYQRLALDKEPYESAARFVREGVTCFALMYRLPGDHWAAGPDAPLQDAQRAMRLIRARASEWRLDPNRVMCMGFSAGGHLAAEVAERFDAGVYPRQDNADALSARPDLSLLLYPVVTMMEPLTHQGSRDLLLGANAGDDIVRRYSIEQIVRADAPPSFLCAAADDEAVPIQNLVLLFQALREKHVPVEMHIFETGGHGFGMRGTVGKPTAQWPELALVFMRAHRMI